jgi:DDHD domain
MMTYVLCHRLGGIITWDILSHQRTPANDKEMEDYAKLDIVYPKLDFKPDYFFALGSPVGAILVFRNQNPLLYRPDDSIIFENIFHPFDPLAYRFEPLLSEKYTDEAAVLIERSIPIGPNFSLPSLPSFPGSSLLSMFSRFSFSSGEATDPAHSTKQLLEASDEAVTQNHQTSGYWKWFTEYFGGQHSHEDGNKQSRASGEGSSGEANAEEEDNNGSTARAHDGDLTTFDGFEGPRVIDCTDNDEDVFDEEASTKWAGGVLSGKYDFTGPLKPRRMGSRLDKNGILTSGVVTAAMIPEKNDYFSIPKSSKTTQHTVDVLGNDGMRVDNLRRAKDAHKSSQYILSQLSQDFDSPLSPTAQQEFLSNMRKVSDVKLNDDTSSIKSHEGARSEISRNSNNIMDDLSKELHEPGAKIMEPRQSSESITKDATIPQEGGQDKRHSKDESEDLPKRMDFVLQPESFMDMLTNEYIVGFRAHFSYWTNKDLQWHILRRLEILDEAEDKDNE